MRTLTDHLAQYAAYHRDRRNIVTHFVGIPMIVVAIIVLLSRPCYTFLTVPLSPAVVLVLASVIFYLMLDFRFGITMLLLNVVTLWIGHAVASQTTGVWLITGIGLFVVGWVFQFIGHYYEGRKPAFVDDVIGLIIGPLFVLAEAAFLMGLRKELRQEVEKQAGPTHIRSKNATASQ